jgi:hypothetical protein
LSTTVVNTAAPATTNTPQAAPADKQPPAVTPEVPSAAKPDEMSSKFAALAKKERVARMQAGQVKKQREELAERERKIAERERLWDEEFKASPLEALKRRGIAYDDITKAALNDGKFDPSTEVKSVKEEIARLRQEQADKEKKAQETQAEAQKRMETEAVERFQNSIAEHITTNKDKFELVALYDAKGLVFQTIEEHFARTNQAGAPKIMSVDEACEQVEKYLESEVERMATSSKKFQSKYSAIKAKEEAQTKNPPKTTTTLTNVVSTSASPSLLPKATEEDRIKRALAALG